MQREWVIRPSHSLAKHSLRRTRYSKPEYPRRPEKKCRTTKGSLLEKEESIEGNRTSKTSKSALSQAGVQLNHQKIIGDKKGFTCAEVASICVNRHGL